MALDTSYLYKTEDLHYKLGEEFFLKMWAGRVWQKMGYFFYFCIVGNVGRRVFGAGATLGTGRQDILVSAALIENVLFEMRVL